MRVSFWLLPVDEDREALGECIEALAREYDAPVFVPHVTLHAGECDGEAAIAAVEAATTFSMGSAVACLPLETTGAIAKTLFIPFGCRSDLDVLAAHFRAAAPSDYEFSPHLSLLYKPLEASIREALAAGHTAPVGRVRFDRVCAVATNGDLSVKADVEAWRTLAQAALSPGGTGLGA